MFKPSTCPENRHHYTCNLSREPGEYPGVACNRVAAPTPERRKCVT